MSPLGKFILSRFDITAGLSGKDIAMISSYMLPNKTFSARYMTIAEYVLKLGLQIHSSYY